MSDPLKIQGSTPQVTGTPLSEDVAAQILPDLEQEYGQLFPITTQEGSVEIYDEAGELIAVISEDGELDVLCEEAAPVEEPDCDPSEQSCEFVPEDEQYSYDDPWLEDSESEALYNQTKLFSDSADQLLISSDDSKSASGVDSTIDIPLFDNDVDEPEILSEEIEPPETKEQEETKVALEWTSDESDKTETQHEAPASQQSQTSTTVPASQTAAPAQAPAAGVVVSTGAQESINAQIISNARDVNSDSASSSEARVHASVKNAIETAIGSLERCLESLEQNVGPSASDAARLFGHWLRGFFGGYGKHSILASEERGEAERRGPDSIRFTKEGRNPHAILAQRNEPLSHSPAPFKSGAFSAGGAAMQDANSDAFAIAAAAANKGGPPYFTSVAYSATAPTTVERTSHNRIEAASPHGDANHHHGEQDDDGRRNNEQPSSEEEMESA